jgi:hypothetical protein
MESTSKKRKLTDHSDEPVRTRTASEFAELETVNEFALRSLQIAMTLLHRSLTATARSQNEPSALSMAPISARQSIGLYPAERRYELSKGFWE